MEPSPDPGTEPVLGEGHYTVVLAGAGHRTLELTVSRSPASRGTTAVEVDSRTLVVIGHVNNDCAARESMAGQANRCR